MQSSSVVHGEKAKEQALPLQVPLLPPASLAQPTSGGASALGHDVVAAPLEVRRRISVVIQETAVELFLTVRDNLGTFARFHGLRDADIYKTRSIAHLGLGNREQALADLRLAETAATGK